MLITTRAIVLRTVRHGDKSVVLKLYTEHNGVRGYAVRIGGKSGVPAALLEPMQRLAIVAQERGDRDLHHLKEVRPDKPFVSIGSDPIKGSVVLFMQEVLLRTLREESADPALFEFVHDALGVLDDEPDLGHFPIGFLCGLCRQHGFAPEPPEGPVTWFDMMDGRFVDHEPAHPHAFTGSLVPLFAQLLETPLGHASNMRASASQRRALLERLLHYFRLHVDGFGELRSPIILQTVLG
jgi:DNA repair protein RecO (recombination protein O)